MKSRRSQPVRLAWYFPEQHQVMLAISEDTEDLHHTYDQWLADYGRTTAACAERGVAFERVTIDPEAWMRWCERQGRSLDRQAREAYLKDHRGRS